MSASLPINNNYSYFVCLHVPRPPRRKYRSRTISAGRTLYSVSSYISFNSIIQNVTQRLAMFSFLSVTEAATQENNNRNLEGIVLWSQTSVSKETHSYDNSVSAMDQRCFPPVGPVCIVLYRLLRASQSISAGNSTLIGL